MTLVECLDEIERLNEEARKDQVRIRNLEGQVAYWQGRAGVPLEDES